MWFNIVLFILFIGWIYNAATFGQRRGASDPMFILNLVLAVLCGAFLIARLV